MAGCHANRGLGAGSTTSASQGPGTQSIALQDNGGQWAFKDKEILSLASQPTRAESMGLLSDALRPRQQQQQQLPVYQRPASPSKERYSDDDYYYSDEDEDDSPPSSSRHSRSGYSSRSVSEQPGIDMSSPWWLIVLGSLVWLIMAVMNIANLVLLGLGKAS
ncbi:hypothetical protein NLG97_g8194 [Lecanicillium saksenae]|uniref:Uncharacterized protein n=1 Tax=Lecanicillium saksenae TaxID=468837 RepID=A0ACC1QM11_9HYPO|nr:hypothetical protein NLG97_g8194 [Lecanicillium saksenae]